MSKSRRSLVRSTFQNFFKLWRRRHEARHGSRPDKRFSPRLESLESRQMFNADPGYSFTDPNIHIHATLTVLINGDQLVIPKGIGDNLPVATNNGKIHTHDISGKMHIHPGAGRTSYVTLGEFLNNWRTDTVVGNNNATLTDTSLFGNNNTDTHIVKMYVNGTLVDNAAEVLADWKISDGENIVLSYESINQTNFPSFDPIANQNVLVGAPTWIGIDGFDPNGGPLTYQIQVGNQNLLEATLGPSSNKSMRMEVENFGTMTFQLFDHLVDDITDHFKQLIALNNFDNSTSLPVTFYRIAKSGGQDFVIQGGPQYGGTGVSSLGRFDDLYHFDLQHTSKGLLSMAKSTDDTNDAQFFVTGNPTRFLDFNHSIFGMLTDGEEVRAAIQSAPISDLDGDGPPVTPIKILNTEIIDDTENAALMLKAKPGASGTTTVTVTVRDAQNNAFTQTFTVTIAADTSNSVPFLSPIQDVTTQPGQTVNLQLVGNDIEGDAITFTAEKPAGNSVNYTLTTNPTSGLVQITPPQGFVGSFQVLVKASQTSGSPNTVDDEDAQLVSVTVANVGAAPTVELADGSDSGVSNTDNITSASSLDFLVTNSTAGATVKLYKGTTEIGQAVVPTGATSVTITVANPGTALGQGTSEITAKQTPNGGTEGPASAALSVVYDTTVPAALTSAAPTLAHVGFNLAHDAQHAEEGTQGFRYSLTGAPTGATINPTSGVITWTPVIGQVGNPSFTIVATDAAGNTVSQAVTVAVVDPRVEFSITLTKPDGSPLTSLAIGQDFVLHIFADDLRPLVGQNPRGVFSAYLDLLFDSTKAAIIDPRTNTPLTSGSFNIADLSTVQLNALFGTSYTGARSGLFAPGSIDELGALASTQPLGADPVELAKITLRATASGTLTFTGNDADVADVHDIVTYDTEPPEDPATVPANEVHYGTASITIAGTFDAVNDSFTAQEDSTANTFDPTANDASIGGATNTLTITGTGTTSSGGVVTITQNGTRINYVPAPNFAGTESFTYTVRNQNNEEHTATISLTVNDVNDAPVATADTASVSRNSSGNVINVLANDNDGVDTGETLRVTSFGTGSAGGTITIGSNGANILYTPAANFSGTESFTYTISDRTTGGLTASAVVTVSVSGLVANNDSVSFTEDTTGNEINPLANDAVDPQFPSGVLTITNVGNRSGGGTATISTDGKKIIYAPAANFQGRESFTYTISDGLGHSATATISVDVTNTNDPPTGVADTVTAFKNTTATFDVLANDSSAPDPTEDLTIDSASLVQPSNGTVSVIENGKKISYTPLNNVVGATSFTYRVRDAGGQLSAPVTVNITVQDFAPGSLAGFVYFDVNNNGVMDAGESPMAGVTITLTGTATSGSVTNVNQTVRTGEDGSYKFENIAPGNYTLAQTQPAFTIDGRESAGSQGGTTNTNDRIVISNFASGASGTGNNFAERGRAAAAISVRDFFASNSRNYAIAAFDNAGASLWHTMQGSAWDGLTGETFSLVNNKAQLRIQANNGQSQPVFSQHSTTGNGIRRLASSGTNILYRVPAPPKITFNPGTPGSAPTAVNDNFSTTPGTALDVAAANGVLKNDTDPENNTLTASVVSTTTKGTLTLSANGSFKYTPNAGFTGTDSFTYRANDGVNLSGLATATINVTTANGAPTGVADSYSATEDQTFTASLSVLTNDTDPQQGTTLTAAIASQATKGTVSLAANGTFTYAPQANFFGTDSFTYRASDGTAQSELTTVTITVAAVNDAPIASNDSFFPKTNTSFTAPVPGVLANDSDPDTAAASLTVTKLTDPASGSLTLNANGSFTYVPANSFTGIVSFTYRVSDGAGGTDDGTVTLTVNPNAPPVATADSYETTEDTAITTNSSNDLLQNDSDPNNDPITAQQVAGPAHGNLSLNADGTFIYTPAQNFTGTDSFTYRASDGTAQSNVATVTITVNAANDAPIAQNDEYTTNRNTALTVTATNGVLKNDSDPDGTGVLTAVLVNGPAQGQLSLSPDGSFTYTPATDFRGTVTFTYKARDGQGLESPTATVTIVVNTLPVANADDYETGEDTPLVVTTSNDVLTNDTDADGDPLSADVEDEPVHGDLSMAPDGSFTYTPDQNFHGTDSFTYFAKDGLSDSAKATVIITVNPVNDAPTAVADQFDANINTELVVPVNDGVLKNDTDLESPASALSAALGAGPANGSLTLNSDGSFRYNPNNNFTGTDSFTYRAGDGALQSTPVTVTIRVNTPPIAANDSYDATEETTLTVTPGQGLLVNDSDPNTGDALTVELATGPASGTLSLNPNGGFSYLPVNNFVGTDSFTYRATDGLADSALATVTITVAERNDPPLALADEYFFPIGNTPVTVDAENGVLDNDTDEEGNSLTATVVTPPATGTLTLNDDGSFTYNPTATFHGAVSFAYKANDGTSDSASVAIVTIVFNTPPEAANDVIPANEDTPLSVPATTGLLDNDSDTDQDELTAELVAGPASGTLTLEEDGSFDYTPALNVNGAVSFTYVVNDGFQDSAPATVIINITSVNDAPVATTDSYTTDEDDDLVVNTADGVKKNDSDADGDALTVEIDDEPAHGSVTLAADGSFTYTPDANYHGPDSFTYKLSDGSVQPVTGTVTITVTSVNDPIEGVADTPTVDEDQTLTVPALGVLANDINGDALPLTATIVGQVLHGVLSLNADGGFVYTPNEDFHGVDSFTYQATDGTDTSATTTVTITINSLPDAPTAGADSYNLDKSQSATLNVSQALGVLLNDDDDDGDNLTAVNVVQPANGTVTMQTDGSFVYTPNPTFTGTDSFTYSASDGTLTTPATVTITVTDGGGEGEGALAAALLSWLAEGAGQSEEESDGEADGNWEDAVDAAMSQLG